VNAWDKPTAILMIVLICLIVVQIGIVEAIASDNSVQTVDENCERKNVSTFYYTKLCERRAVVAVGNNLNTNLGSTGIGIAYVSESSPKINIPRIAEVVGGLLVVLAMSIMYFANKTTPLNVAPVAAFFAAIASSIVFFVDASPIVAFGPAALAIVAAIVTAVSANSGKRKAGMIAGSTYIALVATTFWLN
jgi:hypothetical protein